MSFDYTHCFFCLIIFALLSLQYVNAKTKHLRKVTSSMLVAPKSSKSLALEEMRKTKLKEAKERQAAKLQELKGEEIMIFTSSAEDVINNS